jgi:hypothetical protein
MKRTYFLAFSIVLLLSACSGGSSDAPAPNLPPVGPAPPASLVVTTANAKPAVRVAYGATMESIGTGGVVGDSGIASSQDGSFLKPQVEKTVATALASIFKGVPLGPDTDPCGLSGTTTISGELASLFTLTAGDTINMESAACNDGLGEEINGRIEMTVVVFSGDPAGLYLLEMKVMLVNFEVKTDTDTVLTNGGSIVSIDTLGSPVILMSINGMTIDGLSLTIVSNAGTEIITDFDTSQMVDASVQPEPYSLTASGTVDSTQLGGVISYTTPSPFLGFGAAYPYQGVMVITGADGATITLTAQPDGVTVIITTDTNNDGEPESTEETTWNDIAL